MVVRTGSVVPAGVFNAISRLIPDVTSGQRKSTRVWLAKSTGTKLSLTFTLVPPNSREDPLGSAKSPPARLSHLPFSVATAPGLHRAGATSASEGLPESTANLNLDPVT